MVQGSLGWMNHHHCRIHVRRLQINLRLLQEVEAGQCLLLRMLLLWLWNCRDLLLLWCLMLLLGHLLLLLLVGKY